MDCKLEQAYLSHRDGQWPHTDFQKDLQMVVDVEDPSSSSAVAVVT